MAFNFLCVCGFEFDSRVVSDGDDERYETKDNDDECYETVGHLLSATPAVRQKRSMSSLWPRGGHPQGAPNVTES